MFDKVEHKNTPEKCESACKKASYLYFGVQGGRDGKDCFCGNKLAHQEKIAESECDVPCPGDNSKICGGHWSQSLYQIHTEGKK